MSYQMRIDPKSRNSGRFVLKVQRELQNALTRSGMRQQQVAQKLGLDRSIINRRLTGRANLTLRSIADLAWALDHDVTLSLKPKTVVVQSNERQKDSSTNKFSSATYAPVATEALGTAGVVPAQEPSRNKVTIQHESA